VKPAKDIKGSQVTEEGLLEPVLDEKACLILVAVLDKEKNTVQRLFKKFGYHANGYVGSSMLSNTEFPDEKFNHTKEIVKDVLEEMKNFDVEADFCDRCLKILDELKYSPYKPE